ncbi:MAG: hypothetical protein HY553_12600 [Elusimicrobia bacterium]|nr:hypothetical protein [Elusimicrobiota bacterium]
MDFLVKQEQRLDGAKRKRTILLAGAAGTAFAVFVGWLAVRVEHRRELAAAGGLAVAASGPVGPLARLASALGLELARPAPRANVAMRTAGGAGARGAKGAAAADDGSIEDDLTKENWIDREGEGEDGADEADGPPDTTRLAGGKGELAAIGGLAAAGGVAGSSALGRSGRGPRGAEALSGADPGRGPRGAEALSGANAVRGPNREYAPARPGSGLSAAGRGAAGPGNLRAFAGGLGGGAAGRGGAARGAAAPAFGGAAAPAAAGGADAAVEPAAGDDPPADPPAPEPQATGTNTGTDTGTNLPRATQGEIRNYRTRLAEVKTAFQFEVVAPAVSDLVLMLTAYRPDVKRAREHIEKLRDLNNEDIEYFTNTYPAPDVAKWLRLVQGIMTTGYEGVKGDRGLLTDLIEAEDALNAAVPCLKEFKGDFKNVGKGKKAKASDAVMEDQDLLCARQAEKALRLRGAHGIGFLHRLEQAQNEMGRDDVKQGIELIQTQANASTDAGIKAKKNAAAGRLRSHVAKYRQHVTAAKNALTPSPLGANRKKKSEKTLSPKALGRLQELMALAELNQLPGQDEDGVAVPRMLLEARLAMGEATRSFGMTNNDSTGKQADPTGQYGLATLKGLEALFQIQRSIEVLQRVETLAPLAR